MMGLSDSSLQIQRLREEEVKGYATTRAKHPRALVLLPTRELSHQVRVSPAQQMN
jgi:superfamily II DNA/RNA helicase